MNLYAVRFADLPVSRELMSVWISLPGGDRSFARPSLSSVSADDGSWKTSVLVTETAEQLVVLVFDSNVAGVQVTVRSPDGDELVVPMADDVQTVDIGVSALDVPTMLAWVGHITQGTVPPVLETGPNQTMLDMLNDAREALIAGLDLTGDYSRALAERDNLSAEVARLKRDADASVSKTVAGLSAVGGFIAGVVV